MIEQDIFKQVMGSYTTGIAITTTIFDDNAYALTMNSLTSISLSPPLISFSIRIESGLFKIFHDSLSFGISILSHQQQDIAKLFANKTPTMQQKFAQTDMHLSPKKNFILKSCLATIDCTKKEQHLIGDHLIIFAEVISGNISNGIPLIHFRKQYYDAIQSLKDNKS